MSRPLFIKALMQYFGIKVWLQHRHSMVVVRGTLYHQDGNFYHVMYKYDNKNLNHESLPSPLSTKPQYKIKELDDFTLCVSHNKNVMINHCQQYVVWKTHSYWTLASSRSRPMNDRTNELQGHTSRDQMVLSEVKPQSAVSSLDSLPTLFPTPPIQLPLWSNQSCSSQPPHSSSSFCCEKSSDGRPPKKRWRSCCLTLWGWTKNYSKACSTMTARFWKNPMSQEHRDPMVFHQTTPSAVGASLSWKWCTLPFVTMGGQ